MAQFLTTIGRHLECAIQAELVVELELALIERKQLVDFGTILSYARKIRKHSHRLALCQGQGHAELKMEKPIVKTFSYDLPKLHHSSPNSFGANVHVLRQILFKTVKVRERSRDVTPRSK